MRILLLFFFNLLIHSIFAQSPKKQFFPTKISKVVLNLKAELEIIRQNELLEKSNLTIAEAKERDFLLEKHGEMVTSIWDILEGGCSWYCGGGNYKIKASSNLKTENKTSYNAENANDLNYKTAWVEGKPDDGIGEYLEYYFKNNSARVTKIIISNGYMKSDDAWKNNNRVKKLKLFVNNKEYGLLNLEDSKSDQEFEIGTFGRNKNKTDLIFKFEIVEIYKGEKFSDTVITEIYFDGIDVH